MLQTVPHLHSIIDQDGAVILNNAKGQITTLDAMGGYIWRQLEQGLTGEEIVRELVRETGEDVQVVESDVTEFLADLSSRSLLAGNVGSLQHSEKKS